MRDESNSGSISPEVLAQIDALCEAMDKEDIWARERVTEDGRTPLECCREIWMQRARDGLPLPERWCAEYDASIVEERLAEYGTREWRKAHPWLVSRKAARGSAV